MSPMQSLSNIFLADDDPDDRQLFEEALKHVSEITNLTIAKDGEDLMNILGKPATRPNIFFLDLNMPRKNGLQCLREIKKNEKLKDIPVVVYSTSCQQDAIKQTYDSGASFYICKPDSFQKLIKSIKQIFSFDLINTFPPASMKDFIIAF